ncbi:hypothetical protein HUS23_14055 [Ectothiorhodospiraceae bacterium 2226]|nr:hypothetical protein HUS23_14055 [Ectothiorhodospiraceae bacterium 2226]
MTFDDLNPARLRILIGRRVRHQGQDCQIIEVLDDGPTLILQGDDAVIQANRFGEAHRRVPHTYTVPVCDEHGAPHAEFLALKLAP